MVRMETEDRQDAIVVARPGDAAIQAASSTLEKAGFAVHLAADGNTALGLARQLAGPPALAVVDEAATDVPVAGLVEGLRERSPGIRILVLSDKARKDSSGIRVLRKPFRRSALLGQVLDLMERPKVLTA